MSRSGVFAQVVALVGDAAIRWRRLQGSVHQQALGATPTIPAARPQGRIPTLKMPTARGWAPGQSPIAAPGLTVNAFAGGLKHPRWLHVLPNGDVTVAEALFMPAQPRSVFDHAMVSTLKRAAAVGVSPNRITLLRDADGDGVAETREAFLEGLSQPFGMALLADTFYVGNTDGVVAFPYTPGTTRISAPGRRLTPFKPGGHWTRSLLPSPDGRKLYVGVGSLSNIADHGLEVEQGRACIVELDLASGSSRVYASGLRNPVGLAWEPNKDPKVAQGFLTGPDGVRIEVYGNEALATPVQMHHIHLMVADPAAAQKWYGEHFGATPGKRLTFDTGTVPGAELALSKADAGLVPTKGRSVDHIGFEVKNIDAFVAKLQAAGIKTDAAIRNSTNATGLRIAFITDPWGTEIELTEGLATTPIAGK